MGGKKKKQNCIWLLSAGVLLPLLLGTLNYLLCRPDTYLADYAGQYFGRLPDLLQGAPSWLSFVMRCYASDVLWACSLAVMVYVAGRGLFPSAWLLTVLCAAYAALMELLQLLPASRGTFDPLDILLEVIVIVVVHRFLKMKEKTHEKTHKSHQPDSCTGPVCLDSHGQRQLRQQEGNH